MPATSIAVTEVPVLPGLSVASPSLLRSTPRTSPYARDSLVGHLAEVEIWVRSVVLITPSPSRSRPADTSLYGPPAGIVVVAYPSPSMSTPANKVLSNASTMDPSVVVADVKTLSIVNVSVVSPSPFEVDSDGGLRDRPGYRGCAVRCDRIERTPEHPGGRPCLLQRRLKPGASCVLLIVTSAVCRSAASVGEGEGAASVATFLTNVISPPAVSTLRVEIWSGARDHVEVVNESVGCGAAG